MQGQGEGNLLWDSGSDIEDMMCAMNRKDRQNPLWIEEPGAVEGVRNLALLRGRPGIVATQDSDRTSGANLTACHIKFMEWCISW
jgi:hypothetical protein